MSTKPIKLYSHATGPNPWKVAIILEELGIPYETEFIDFKVIKQAPYTDVNPNGRVPAIEDPNTGVTLWESGAIITYLAETYDKDGKISYAGKAPEKWQELQWVMFQMSGQGPYMGQAAWFTMFHHEKLPSAVERYQKEADRIVSVIDSHLAKTGKKALVGDKVTYADLIFVPWFGMLPFVAPNTSLDKYPKFKAWYDGLLARPAVAKVTAEKDKKRQEAGH